jgi:hypothetical protein
VWVGVARVCGVVAGVCGVCVWDYSDGILTLFLPSASLVCALLSTRELVCLLALAGSLLVVASRVCTLPHLWDQIRCVALPPRGLVTVGNVGRGDRDHRSVCTPHTTPPTIVCLWSAVD